MTWNQVRGRMRLVAVMLFLAPAVGGAGQPRGVNSSKPNILFILADDLGARDLSNEGSTFYESPNIDRIASMGMKFTRGYATCQVCSPSRASILTGKYPVNTGITTWIGDPSGEAWRKARREDSHLPADYEHQLRSSEITLAEVLRAAGYTTFFAGKWHLGGEGSWPQDHGFKVNKGGWHAGSPSGGYFAPYKNPNLEDGPDGESLPIRLGRETAAFIEANKGKPFLAYLSFYSVHGPIQTTAGLWKKYRDKAVAAGLVNERFLFDRRLPVRQVQDCPIYAGMIESMDEAVGIVLRALEEHGLLENTIICFTSDNGGVSSGDAFSTSNLPLRGGKGRQWEGGIREPFYLYAPGVTRAGSVTDTPVSGIDWYPTLLELVRIPIPKGQAVDGVSLVPLLRGGSIDRRPLFWHYPHYGNQGGEPSSIVLEGDWKLIYYHEDEHYELYNLTRNVVEQVDLAAAEPGRAKAMEIRLQQWLRSSPARFPVRDPQFDPAKREARWERLRTSGKVQLERQHAGYLEEGFQPNQDWWGSAAGRGSEEVVTPGSAVSGSAQEGGDNPNILVILTDDQGWADIGYNNPEKVYTPNLDRLAAEGVVFANHYVMPQCTPTRVAVFTGRYPGRFGRTALQASNEPAFPKGTPTLASMLKSVGYETYLCGKWHMGSSTGHGPNHFGFDRSYGSFAGAVGMYDHRYRTGTFEETWHRDHEIIPGYENGQHATDLVAQEAVRVIQQEREAPLFLYLAFHAPHTPLDERGRFVDRPTQLDPVNPERWLNEDEIRWFNDPDGKIQRESDPERRLFLAVVHHLDHAIGKVVEALEESGQRENTLILFSSDNGPQVNWSGGAYPDDLKLTDFNQPLPMRGSKCDVWEGGIRVPGLAHWPGRLKPKIVADSVHVIDWFPTLAALTGAAVRGNLDGTDLSGVLFKDQVLAARELYWIWNSRTDRWALRFGDQKIVHYGRSEPSRPSDWQLFDLATDPREQLDLAREESGVVADLHRLFVRQRARDQR